MRKITYIMGVNETKEKLGCTKFLASQIISKINERKLKYGIPVKQSTITNLDLEEAYYIELKD